MGEYMTVSKLIEILSKLKEKEGDLTVLVNTQDGGSYGLYSEDDISVVTWFDNDGSKIDVIEIG
jgi:hypothetical protein